MTASAPPCTEGTLLGGRVRYRQPASGFRSGIEPVLLAAAVPARSGERVLEGGTGAGAALLCLAVRVQRLSGRGIERDPDLAALAGENARANGFDTLEFAFGLVEELTGEPFDHAMANPPYHADEGTHSPDPNREAAKRGNGALLATWAVALGRRLRARGTLTFIVPAAVLPATLAGFGAAGCQPAAVLPLWPKAGRPAKLVIVQGIKGGRSPMKLLPGLVLHRPDGGFSAEADTILRDGGPLRLT